MAILIAPDDSVMYVSNYAGGSVDRYTRGGAGTSWTDVAPNWQSMWVSYSGPCALAFDQPNNMAANILVAGNSGLLKYTPAGTLVATYVVTGWPWTYTIFQTQSFVVNGI